MPQWVLAPRVAASDACRVRRTLFTGSLVAAVLAAGLLVGCDAPPKVRVPPAVTLHADLGYCHGQTLDLYVPNDQRGPMPIAMFVHGGGMTGGDKSDLRQAFLDALVKGGFAVASINYRLAPRYEFPAQIEDVTCAVRYLRAEATRYGLDPHEVFAFGTSVGGELVALAALSGKRSTFDVGQYGNQSSALTAVADLFGPANLTQPGSGFTRGDLAEVFGSNLRHGPSLASPTHYVAPGAPPILVVQGVDDAKVLESQAIELYGDLAAAGDPTRLLLVQHMGHMFVQVGTEPIAPSLGQIANDVVRFFDLARQRWRLGEALPS